MTYDKLRYAVLDGVATIELDDPPANTYSYEIDTKARRRHGKYLPGFVSSSLRGHDE